MEAYDTASSKRIIAFGLLITFLAMPILGALGLGMTIIVLQSLVPRIFTEIEHTVLALLYAAQISLSVATQLAGAAEVLIR